MEKIFKKSLALMVSAALCLTAFVGCLTVNAETAGSATVEVGKVTAKTTATTVEVPVTVSTTEATGIAAAIFDITVDSAKFDFSKRYWDSCLTYDTTQNIHVSTITNGDYIQPVNGTDNTYRFLVEGLAEGSTDENTLGTFTSATFKLTFDVIDNTAGATAITFASTIAPQACNAGTFDIDSATYTGKELPFDVSTVAGSITVEAAVATTHKVTFVDADGNTLSEQDVNDGEAAVAPELPRKIGYSAAWDKEYSNITEDTVVTATYTAAVVTTKGIGAQLALESTFTFRFTFTKTNYSGGTLLYAVVNKLVVDGEGIESYEESVFEGDQLFSYDNDSKMAFIYSGIAAKEMTNEINVQFYYELDGVLYSSKVGTTSVAKLALSQMGKATGDKADALKTLVVDMLNYGTAAQNYYGYRTDDLANQFSTSTDSVSNYASYATVDDPVFTETTTTSGSHLYGMGLSMNLTIGNTVDLNFLIKPGTYEESTGKVLKDTLEFRYSYTTTVGTVVNGVVTAAEWADNGDGRYRYQFNVLAAKDLRTPVTIGVYDDAGNLVTKSATTSIAAYAAKQTDSAVVTVINAMFRFSDSARAYFS